MRVIINEIKHIFNWKMALILVLFTAAFYYMFIIFDIQCFPNGTSNTYDYKIAVGMLKTYGRTMDTNEFKNFEQIYNQRVKVADSYIQSQSEFKQAGITTYKAFKNLDVSTPIYSKLSDKAFSKDNVSLFEKLQESENIISSYENMNNEKNDLALTSAQKVRINEIISSGSLKSIFPSEIFENYNDLICYDAILIILCVIFMLGPVYLKDRRNNVNYMQYSSKTGRRIFKKKIASSILSAFILITLQFVLLFAVYSHNNTGMFFGSGIMSFYNGIYSWYNLTFLQYIIMTVAGVYVMGLCAALITLLASRLAPNYITLIGILIAIAFVFIKVLPTYMLTHLTTIALPQFLTPTVYAIVAAVAIVPFVMMWRHEKRIDILN
jgi:hypothetical protein